MFNPVSSYKSILWCQVVLYFDLSYNVPNVHENLSVVFITKIGGYTVAFIAECLKLNNRPSSWCIHAYISELTPMLHSSIAVRGHKL